MQSLQYPSYKRKRHGEDSVLRFLAFILVVITLTVVAFYSAKGFCTAITRQPDSIPAFAVHSLLQTMTGGPVGLYGIAWYLASTSTTMF
jgi:hypothetical protein